MEAFQYEQANLAAFNHGTTNDRVGVINQVGNAMTEVGFVELVRPDSFDSGLLRQVQDVCNWLFHHSDEELVPYEWPEVKRECGFTPFGSEQAAGTDFYNACRYWHFWQLPHRDMAYLRQYAEWEKKEGRLSPRNLWPLCGSSEDQARFFQVITSCFEPYANFGVEVAQILELYLDVKPGTISDLLPGGETIMRLLDYPPVEEWPEGKKLIRNFGHIDSSIFTFLATAWSNGKDKATQIKTRDGVWRDGLATEGALILNGGHLLTKITNGKIRACPHRVLNPERKTHWRRINPVFVHPRPWEKLYVLPTCTDAKEPDFLGTAAEVRDEILNQNYPDDPPV